MRQSRHPQQLSLPPSIVATVRRRRLALALAGTASLLLGMLLGVGPAASAAGSMFAVTELQLPQSQVSCCVGGIAADTATDTVYAALGTNGVAVVDGANGTVTDQISVPTGPGFVAVDQASDTVYAIVQGSQAAAVVINGATDAVTTQISLPSGLFSFGAAANPMTHMVYVTDRVHRTVVAVDGSAGTTATIPLVGPLFAPTASPWGLAVDTATNTVYVADPRDNQVAVINGATNAVTGAIALPIGSAPLAVAVDSNAGLVYTANDNGTISVISTPTDSVSTLASGLTSPQLRGLALDSGGATLYAVSSGSATDPGTTYVIDTASGAITARIPRGGTSVAVSASPGPVFVGGNQNLPLDHELTVITPSTVSTMSPIIVGSPTFTFTVGQAGQGQLNASATPAAATFSATGLPSWLTLSPSGLLTGTPPAGTEGAYFPVVTASNGVAPPGSADIVVTVDEAPAITSPAQVTFQEGVSGSFTATATGIPPPDVSESGTLPAGVTFTAVPPTGLLSGAPAAGTAGVYPITITATNTSGTATQAFTLTVAAPPAVAVGVEGTDSQLWVQSPLGGGWQPLGGVITAPPAVIARPNPFGATPVQPWFLATGTDQRLWIRSLTANWQPTGPADCLGGPAAAVTGTGTSAVVTVACRGLDNALWYTTTPMSALPALSGTWTRVPSGVLSAAPAVAPVGTTMTFMVRGEDGAIWMWSATGGWSRTGWLCNAGPAAAQQAATGVTTFACQGSDGMLWTATNGGAGWSVPVSLGGPIAGSPGIAATSAETDILVEGLDQAVWERTPAGWSRIDASITGGAAATALN